MNFDDILKQLQKNYVQGMPSKIKAMHECEKSSDYESLREEFHKIKGTGKTYGLPEVSDLGGLFEEILIQSKFNPEKKWVTQAISLFEDIHLARINEKSFDLSGDARFKSLQNALSLLKK